MPCVPFVGAVESVFLGGQDLVPSVHEQILVSFELLLLPLQAPRSGHELLLEANFFHGILRHAEFIIAEAYLIFGGGHIVVPFQVSDHGQSSLLEGRLIRVVFIFGTIWIVFVS